MAKKKSSTTSDDTVTVAVTNKYLESAISALKAIGSRHRYPAKTRLRIVGMKRTIAEVYGDVIEAHNSLIEEYGVEQEDGSHEVPKDADNREEFDEKKNELLEIESPVPVAPLPWDMIARNGDDYGDELDILLELGLIAWPETEDDDGADE